MNAYGTLQPGEQRRLHKGVANRVYEIVQDKQEATKLFKALFHDIKVHFAVSSYKEINRRDLQRAIRYIENWTPRKVS